MRVDDEEKICETNTSKNKSNGRFWICHSGEQCTERLQNQFIDSGCGLQPYQNDAISLLLH